MVKRNWRRRKFLTKKKNVHKLFFLIVIGMTLGFAAINTTLQFIGTLNIARTTWNIHWANPTKTGGVTASDDVHLKSGDSTTVEYTVNLANQGEYYEFTVDAQNEGTIDAMITGIDNKVYENNVEVAKPDYLDFIVTYGDDTAIANNHLLAAGKSETYKVKVMYKDNLTADQLPTSNRNLKFTFTVTYMQSDEDIAQPVRSIWTLPSGRTRDTLEVGDEVCVQDQCFYFIKYDGNDVVMLSKYNLNVGNNPKGTETFKQDSDVKGWQSSGTTTYGNVGFSKTPNYWVENDTVKSKYGTDYPADVYDTDYVTAPDFSESCDTLPTSATHCYNTEGYSIAYYVEQYKTILEGNTYKAAIKNVRLLKYSEATDSSIGCDASNNTCPATFITSTSYWLGTAANNNTIWRISNANNFYSSNVGSKADFGVRPVIVISKANI